MDVVRQTWALAHDSRQLKWIAPLLWLADGMLCIAIIKIIPCTTTGQQRHHTDNFIDTEIDWQAYMQQIAIYLAGERDYLKIQGDTGPLVYPGGHVYIYRLLYTLTRSGDDILLAQGIFALLYLSTLALVMLCYKRAGAPPIIFPLLILSKRLHSIFMLRLFNDAFAVFFLFLAIYAYQRRMWTLGSVAYSCGLGVKMSLLLALPAVGIILWQARGRDPALKQALIIGQWQVLLGHEFLLKHATSYISRAFEFSRQFLFKWTVNWRFVGEETFLSRPFSVALLTAHVSLLITLLSISWLQPSGLNLLQVPQALLSPPSKAVQDKIGARVKPDFVLFAMLSSIIGGCLFARSLHYQFYSYVAWSMPFLLWRNGMHPVLIYVVWAAQEWAWNVYPSTDISSMVVVASLAVTVLTSLIGTSSTWTGDVPPQKSKIK